MEIKTNLGKEITNDRLEEFYIHNKFALDGVEDDVAVKELEKWKNSPSTYRTDLESYSMYLYTSNGDYFQRQDLITILPTLEHKIEAIKPSKATKNHIEKCNMVLSKINHKELTRDIISQTINGGTLCGIWIGRENDEKEIPYAYIFDDLQYFTPGYRVRGKWNVKCDLSYFDSFNDDERSIMFNNLKPYITTSMYLSYRNNQEKKYVYLPTDRCFVIRTHTCKRNQRFGTSWVTQPISDIQHKTKLKNLEKVGANKIIGSPDTLTIGIHENNVQGTGNNSWIGLKSKKNSIISSVKNALSKVRKSGVGMLVLPEWGTYKAAEQRTDVLKADKIEAVNDDVRTTLGYNDALVGGNSANYGSAKMNLDILYMKIKVLLEMIESEVYNKLFEIMCPSTITLTMEYEKGTPLTNKEKSDMLYKLHSFGYSLKPLVEMLGEDFESYIYQSLFEIEEMELRDKIKPPQSSSTLSNETGEGTGIGEGEEDGDTSGNENTQKTKKKQEKNNKNKSKK